MKKIRCVISIVLVLSLLLNAFCMIEHFRYIEKCKIDSNETIMVAYKFEYIYLQVKKIIDFKKIDEGDLRFLQESVAIANYKLSNFPIKHNMGTNNEGDHYLSNKFSNLKDIVFKIEDGNNIPDYICDALIRYELVAYLEELSVVSKAYICEHYGEAVPDGQAGPFDGEKLYKELAMVVS